MNNLLYTISKENHNAKDLREILNNHPEIKFASFVGIDLSGNDTDEKIPMKLFLEDIDAFLKGVAIQTDGSSVVLPGIATLDNAKVDMVIDLNCKWFIDYNYDYIEKEDELTTLKVVFNGEFEDLKKFNNIVEPIVGYKCFNIYE